MKKLFRFCSLYKISASVTFFALLFFATIFFYKHDVLAAPNLQINYQGKLTNATNIAVPDGVYHMRLWLLTSPSAATTTALWTEDRSTAAGDRVTVRSGLFSIMLGSSTPLTNINFNQTLYLGIEIGGSAGAPTWDGEMSPRKVLGTVPAAFESQSLGGASSTQYLRSDAPTTLSTTTAATLLTITQQGTGDILNIFDGTTEVFSILDGGNVGIGSTSPSAKLTIAGGNLHVGGFITATSTATSTFSGGISMANFALTGSATSTAQNGFDITSGCYAVNGTCLTTGSSFGTTSIDTSAKLASIVTDETGSGALVFANSPTLAGFLSTASSTIGGGTQATGLTIYGGATTTGTLAVQGSGTSTFTGGVSLPAINFANTSGAIMYIDGVQLAAASSAGIGTFFGLNAGASSTLTDINADNTAFGANALRRTVPGGASGTENTAIGAWALEHNINGYNNTAVGVAALNQADANDNTAFGLSSLEATLTGGNAAFGNLSGQSNINGYALSLFGTYSGVLVDGLSNAAAIGYNAKVGASNSLILGGTGAESVNVGVGTTSPYAKLSVAAGSTDTNTTLFAISSSTSGTTTTLFNVSNSGRVAIGTTTNPLSALVIGRGVGDSSHAVDIYSPAYTDYLANPQTVVSINKTNDNQAVTLQFQAAGANTTSNVNWAMGIGANTNNYSFSAWDGTSLKERLSLINTGNLGLGTTTPFAKLSISASNGDTNTTLFAISSSTASATTSLFSISNTGSTTASNGFNITSGCFAVNSVCLANSTFGTTSIDTSAKLASIVTDETGSAGGGLLVFSNAPTLAGATITGNTTLTNATATNFFATTASSTNLYTRFASSSVLSVSGTSYLASIFATASSTIGGGTPQTGLTVSGGATTTLGFTSLSATAVSSFLGTLSVGSSTPSTSNLFSVGTTTAFLVVDKNTGYVGVGSTTPSSPFTVAFPSKSLVANLGNTVSIYGTDNEGGGYAGGVYIAGGNETSQYSTGASILVQGTQSQVGGSINISAGKGNNNAAGGAVNITGGYANNSGGANVNISGGIGSNGRSGSVFIYPGTVGGGGNGNVLLGINSAGTSAGNVGVGTTSPYAKLSISAASTDTNTTLFAVSSSTASATVSLFSISNTGSTTASNGFNITSGCFAVSGTCISNTASASITGLLAAADWTTFNNKISSTSIDTSSELATLVTDETGSAGGGLLVFSNSPTLTGTASLASFRASASSTIGGGTQITGLTVSGGATTTLNHYIGGNVGIGVQPGSSQLLSIGSPDFGVATGTMNVFQTLGPGSTAGNYAIVTQEVSRGFTSAGNMILHLSGVRRDASGSDWLTMRWHDGLGVDSSYVIPGSTTRTWWERDLNDDIQEWGTAATPYMTLTSTGLGIGSSTPYAKLSVTNTGSGPSFVVEDSTSPDTTPFLIDASGNVAIGTTTSSLAKVSVYTGYAGTQGSMFIHQNAAANNPTLYIRQSGSGGSADNTQGLLVEVQGNASSNIADFAYWDGTTATSRLIVRRNGNIGIGTTTPSARLDIRASSANVALVVADGVANFTDKLGRIGSAHYDNSEEPLALITGYSRAASNAVMIGGGTSIMNAATSIVFYTAAATTTLTGTERMRVDSAGNVGINNAAPAVNLHIASTSAGLLTTPFALHNVSNTTATAVQFRLLNSAAADALNSVTNGSVDFRNVRQSTGAADLSILMSPGGGAVPVTQFTIQGASGNVGIGTTTPLEKLEVRGTGLFTRQGFSGADQSLENYLPGLADIYIGEIIKGYGKYTDDDNSLQSAYVIKGEHRSGWDTSVTIGTNSNHDLTNRQELTIRNGRIGIGTTSPFAKLSVHANAADTLTSLFIIASSTANSTTTLFRVTNSGLVGIGTSTPVSTLSIQGSLCVRDTGTCGTTPGTIYATTAAISDIDLAENYRVTDNTLRAGEIVTLDTATSSTIKRAQKGSILLGIISTAPGLLLGQDIKDGKPVALKGRVPMLVNMEGGIIKAGDPVTLSSVPGVGMKATTTVQIVGLALTDANSSGLVEVFVENRMYLSLDRYAALNELFAFGTSSSTQALAEGSFMKNFVGRIFAETKSWLASAANGIGFVFADSFRAKNEICVGNQCLTQSDVAALLQQVQNGAQGGGGSGGGGNPNPVPNPAPEPTPTPNPAPELPPDPAPAPPVEDPGSDAPPPADTQSEVVPPPADPPPEDPVPESAPASVSDPEV